MRTARGKNNSCKYQKKGIDVFHRRMQFSWGKNRKSCERTKRHIDRFANHCKYLIGYFRFTVPVTQYTSEWLSGKSRLAKAITVLVSVTHTELKKAPSLAGRLGNG